jgi:lipooligosaccharide transport system ATP-binding protein
MNAANELPLVHARGLIKHFGDLVAVDGIDFDVQKGEAFGFLGPNGAGKTSTMRMIGCVSPPSGGALTILGLDPVAHGPEIRGRLGVVPQQDTLDFELTVRENIIIYGRYFGLPRRQLRERAEELLDFVQLTERADDRVEPLSGGMKRRLTIARLFRLKQRGVTLILTTHYMDEAEQLCDRLVVMDKAKIVAEGSPLDLIDRYSTREVVELRFGVDQQPEHVAARMDGLVHRLEALPDRLLLYTDDGDTAASRVHEIGLQPDSVLVRRSTLEDVFLHLTGRTLVDE